MKVSDCGLSYSQDFMEKGSVLCLKDEDILGYRNSVVYSFTQLCQMPFAVLGQDEE